MYLQIEQNYSVYTLTSYTFDLKLYVEFLKENDRSLDLNDLTTSSLRRFVQNQVIHHNINFLHHLRNTFATLLFQEIKDKVDLRTLQELLGHESLVTTSMYIYTYRF
jgi:integrase/recombinase XerD